MNKYNFCFYIDIHNNGEQEIYNLEVKAGSRQLAVTNVLNELERPYIRVDDCFLKTSRIVNFYVQEVEEEQQ